MRLGPDARQRRAIASGTSSRSSSWLARCVPAVTRLLLLVPIALALVPAAASAPASHTVASFYTPQQAAYCKFHVPLDYSPRLDSRLECWTPNDGFTVWMRHDGRVRRTYDRSNKWRYARSIRRLTFGRSWWGSEDGLRVDEAGNPYLEYREGIGSPRGTVLYRCTSRSTGLTCRNRAGHGWWLGRFRGYRIF